MRRGQTRSVTRGTSAAVLERVGGAGRCQAHAPTEDLGRLSGVRLLRDLVAALSSPPSRPIRRRVRPDDQGPIRPQGTSGSAPSRASVAGVTSRHSSRLGFTESSPEPKNSTIYSAQRSPEISFISRHDNVPITLFRIRSVRDRAGQLTFGLRWVPRLGFRSRRKAG
jgi:hypothetical protein